MKKVAELVWVWMKVSWLWSWRTPPGRYVLNILVAFDQLANSVLLGDPQETISGRLGKWHRKNPTHPVAGTVCTLLNLLEKDHCKRSIRDKEGSDDFIK